jgi:hypothetical protein
MNAQQSLARLLVISTLPVAPYDSANAGCSYSYKGSYICIIKVTASPSTPHLNTVYTTYNGEPVTMKVDCSDFTFNMGSGWAKFEIDSPIHEVCSKWSF